MPPRRMSFFHNVSPRGAVGDFVHAHGLDTPLLELAIRQWQAYADGGNGEADSASISRLYGQ